MLPPYIRTIQDEILYEFAKLISRTAYGSLRPGFISDRFEKLRDGRITIADTIREWEREQEVPKHCVFCGALEGLATGYLIPRNRGGDDSSDNLVPVCASCTLARGDKGIFEWLGLRRKEELHPLVAGRYLKLLSVVHERAATLEISREEIGGMCEHCPTPGLCEEWDSIGELTCFCLESVLPRHL